MKSKRILGIVLVVVGIIMIIFSAYIKNEVEKGKIQISSAEKQVGQAKGLFDLNPFTKPIGKGLTGAAQYKIDQGKRDVAYYESLSSWLMIGGIVLIVIGAVLILISIKRKKS